MNRRIFSILSVCIWAFLSTQFVHAQSYYGALTGTLTDPSGAVVPKATVVATELNKGSASSGISNEAGIYRLVDLTPGIYRIEVKAPGFRTSVIERVVIAYNQTSTLDLALEVGASTESVSVTAQAPVLQVEAGTSTAVVEGSMVNKLPMDVGSRPDIRTTVYRLPNSQYGYSGRMMINGARTSQVRWETDGLLYRSTINNSQQQQSSINYEAIQEWKYTLVNAGAESQGEAQVTLLTKSGTNTFHGAIYFDTHHSAFDAGAHTLPAGARIPFARQNYEGFTLDGPVFIPKLYNGRNRTFWTFTFERNQNGSRGDTFITTPTQAMRTGDFSGLRNSSGVLTPIRDPLTGQPFEGNVIPASRLYPGTVAFLNKFYPQPNIQTSLFSNNAFVPGFTVTKTISHRLDLRVDQLIKSKNNFFFRMNRYTNPDNSYVDMFVTGRNISHFVFDSYQFSDIHTLRPTLLNEFRFGTVGTFNIQRVGVTAQSVLDLLGVQGVPPILYTNGITGAPVISVTGINSYTQYSHLNTLPRLWDIYDNMTFIHGRHSVKYGVNLRKDTYYSLAYDPPGNFSFTGFFTGVGAADFVLGLPFTSIRSYPRAALGPTEMKGWYVGAFAQDDIKLSPRLTVNLGVRWDTNLPGEETHGFYYTLNPSTGSLVVPTSAAINAIVPTFPTAVTLQTASQAGLPSRLRNTDWNNFGPRVGLAWRPLGEKTVIRTAYGIYYDNFSLNYINSAQAPWGGSETFTNSLTNGRPLWQLPSAFPAGVAGQRPGTVSVNGFDASLKNPYAQQWNLTIDQQAEQITFRMQYVGTKSTALYWLRNVNSPEPSVISYSPSRLPFPQFGTANYKTNGGNSTYHALTVGAERRLQGGITFNSYWTWARMLTDSYDGTENATLDFLPWYPTFNRAKWRGPETNVPKFRWTTIWYAELPVGRGKKIGSGWNPVVNQVLGGWGLNGILNIETGWWYSPYYAGGTDPAGINFNQGPPDRIANGVLSNQGLQPNDFFLTPSAFVMPPNNAGRFGTSGINFLQEPSFWTFNLGAQKSFPIRERLRFELDTRFINLFNHGYWGHSAYLNGLNLSNPATFGRVVAGPTGNRQISFLLRLAW